MGHHEHRLALREHGERLLDESLVFRISERRRFVEHDYRSVFEDRPGKGDALALATRQIDAARAHHGIEPIGELGNDVVASGGAGRRLHLPARRVGSGGADVVGKALLEQPVILEHERHAVHKAGKRDIAHVDAADPHGAFARVPEPRHQARRRRLAAATRPHERHRGACGHAQRHVLERRAVGSGVREGYAVELDRIVRRLRSARGSASAITGASRMRSMRMTASCASVSACEAYITFVIIMVVSAEKTT